MLFKNLNHSNKQKGFTLLELLLVIAIIAILAAIVIVAINPARQLAQARNAQRASDLNALHKAVQQYYIDEGEWPADGNNELDAVLEDICGTGVNTSCIDLEAVLVPTYIPAMPVNPSGGAYQIALNDNGKLELAAEGSGEQDLTPVVIGTTTAVVTVGGGGDDPECSDGEDNDGDEAIDYDDGNGDPDCTSDSDDNETGAVVVACEATGGTIDTSSVPGYKIHIFDTVGSDTFNVNSESCEIDIVVVAGGGGGGGFYHAGGGGAGGVVYSPGGIVEIGSYAITVGSGGSGGEGEIDSAGVSGGDSSFDDYIAYGGGGGGTFHSYSPASDGGSGGGAGWFSTTLGGNADPLDQGNDGGSHLPGHQDDSRAASGGGGAGSVGESAPIFSPYLKSGDGGVGVDFSSIFGYSIGDDGWFAGGGGGGGHMGYSQPTHAGHGGLGGGGDGSDNSSPASSGISGTGGGGGGTGVEGSDGGSGGSGIVIVRYAI